MLSHRFVTADASGQWTGTLYVLHGFLGSGRNWSSFASRLVERRPDWRVALVDLRLHGDSREAEPPHDISACAHDLVDLHSTIGDGGRVAVLGHSFGGKVALRATPMLVPAPMQTWVIESTPAPTAGDGASQRMLQLLAESPERFASRERAVEWITLGGFDEPVARWMAMNLRRGEEDWGWELDVRGLEDLLGSFRETDLWSVVEADAPDHDIRIVQASQGSILTTAAAERIGDATVLEGGHWLHIDNPAGLLDLIASNLPT